MTQKRQRVGRRDFLKKGAAAGLGASALPGLAAQAQTTQRRWDRVADVVVIGAGASGLPAAIRARDLGATVIIVEENFDIGGNAMVSGGSVPLGGGTSLQKKYGIEDSADRVFADWTTNKHFWGRYNDREIVRVWADNNAPAFEFLVQNGVKFIDQAPAKTGIDGSIQSVPRTNRAELPPGGVKVTMAGRNGSGVVRPLAASARAKGVEILLNTKMTSIVREHPQSGRVLGITTTNTKTNATVNIQARRSVVIATGGHTSNVNFRRIFDPRLTEEYETVGEPWVKNPGEGEIAGLLIGASLWLACGQALDEDPRTPGLRSNRLSKRSLVGCEFGGVYFPPDSPVFPLARATGLTIEDWQDVILVNQAGRRFWNEDDGSTDFKNACMQSDGSATNGGGPIWAIFDTDAVTREKWNPKPPNVDLEGWFFTADTLPELAAKVVKNRHQKRPMPAAALQDAVIRYNTFVDAGKDSDFGKPAPLHKVQKPPFYAAWATPLTHDSLVGLRVNPKMQVIDLFGQVIPGLYCVGESSGGFIMHGLPRCLVLGYIGGKEAAMDAGKS